MKVTLFTPARQNNFGSVSSNLGDLVIEEAVLKWLSKIFVDDLEVIRYATHVFPPYRSFFRSISNSDYIFVGGSNLLHPPFCRLSKWRLRSLHRLIIRRAILMGCGWGSYLDLTPRQVDRVRLQTTLSKFFSHSVRDSYTLNRLQPYLNGYSILNTGCPSTWEFGEYEYHRLPRRKSDVCLLTLTDFSPDANRDSQLLSIALNSYTHVLFWPQGSGDLTYFLELLAKTPCSQRILVSGIDSAKDFILKAGADSGRRCLGILRHSYAEYTRLVESPEIQYDYLGTRLHGGIKSLASYRRSLIVGIDNRAIEMAKDIGLPVAAATSVDEWRAFANGSSTYDFKLRLNSKALSSWMGQFRVHQSDSQRH